MQGQAIWQELVQMEDPHLLEVLVLDTSYIATTYAIADWLEQTELLY